MSFITVSHLSFSHSASPLLADVSFQVAPGQRAFVVGPNGCGKTTLLRLVEGRLTPDAGGVEAPTAPVIGDLTRSGVTVGALIDEVCAPARALEEEFGRVSLALAAAPEDARLVTEYDDLLARLEAADVWSLDTRVQQILGGLGLVDLDARRPLASLSPGQRARIGLAATLVARPEALLLDEPTNHLDDAARDFLVEIVTSWKGPVLMVSHDRDFIDRTASFLIDLDVVPWQAQALIDGGAPEGGAHRCAGGWADFLAAKRIARERHRAAHASGRAERDRLRAHQRASTTVGHADFSPRTESRIAQKFYADRAQKVSTRRINDDARRLEELAAREVRRPREEHLRFEFPPAPPLAGIAVRAREAHVPGRLSRADVEVGAGEHLLVTGGNGSGKSTLLTWWASGVAPSEGASGEVWALGPIGHVPQRLPTPEDLGERGDLWESGIGEIGKGFLHPRHWATPLADLSAGNLRRAQIALALEAAPSVLILDEPTNYLDLEGLTALEEALRQWSGTLVVASHDRWLIDHWEEGHAHPRQLVLPAAER